MKVISFSDHLYDLSLFMKAGIHPSTLLDAYKPYLFTENQYKEIQKVKIASYIHQTSEAWPLLRELHVETDGKGKPILLYNDVGGMGDNIIMWAFSRILHKRGYKIHVLIRPGYGSLWLGHPWVQSITYLPISWDFVQQFHAHVFFEYLTNWYTHKDQGHPLDIMLTKVGIDPDSIPENEKRVVPEFTNLEQEVSSKIYTEKRLAFFQLSASQHSRSLGPEHSRKLLTALAKAFPEIHWIGLYGGQTSPAYYEPPLVEPNIEFRLFEKIRIFWALLRRAEVCIGPDSMLVHAAGTLGIPCVGLWGTHDPQSRVRYYPKHFPIFLSQKCPKSPCYWSQKDMPNYCPDEVPDRTRCGVLQAISEDILIAKVREALTSNGKNEVQKHMTDNTVNNFSLSSR